MALGPIEVIVIAFPENRFTGKIVPEIERLVAENTISIVDGLFATKDAEGATTFVELDEDGLSDDVAAIAALFDRVDGLISDEDVEELMAGLEPNSSAALLVFEHTWAKPLQDAIIDAGGVMAENFRVPNSVVEEVLAAVAELD